MQDVLNDTSSPQLMERFFPGWVTVHCCNDGRNHRFLSGNSSALFGFSDRELNNKTLADLMDLVHPEDREACGRLRRKVSEYASSVDSDEVQQYRFVMHYRIRRGYSGAYFCLYDEEQFYVNGQGELERLILCRDASAERPFVRVQLDIYKVHPLGYRKVSTYVPTATDQDNSLTSREIEVVELIKEGLSSKEIAERLFISLNTVRNHRSNLFRKTNARNMVDLLNTAAVS